MPDLSEGFMLMIFGMITVFAFLFILMAYMVFVPMLSRLGGRKDNPAKNNPSTMDQNKGNNPSKNFNPGFNPPLEQKPNNDTIPPNVVAAIAAALFSHTGKKARTITIQTSKGNIEQYNLWGIAGRQEIMTSRDISGQVGFQY